MSRVSEPMFYERDENYEGMPFEAFAPKHITEWRIHGAPSSDTWRLYDTAPLDYKPRHRNTPSWEATPISDALRDFIGGV